MVDELKDGEFYMDPNGVPMPKRSLHEHQYTVEQLREMKQKYLMENVINCGYDPTEFAQFMEYKMEGGTNVDNWDFEGLMNVVTEFQQHYQIGGSSTPHANDAQPVANGMAESVAAGEDANDAAAASATIADNTGAEESKKDPPEESRDSDFEDITDDAIQYRDQSKKDDLTLPKLQTRTRAPTAKIVATPLNNRKVTLKVTDSEVRKGGFFSSDYVLYTISSEPLGWKVGRKDSDFYTLRRILKAQFPHILIPPLPVKSNKMTQKFLTKREKQFQRFLQAISRSEELKSSICLNNFLEIVDLKEFQKANKLFEKAKYGKSIVELVTEKGSVGVNMNQNAMVFCTRMTDFTDSYQILYQEIIETTREIKEKSADLAKTMHTLGEHLEKLGNINYMIRVDRLHELYAWLSKMSTGTGNHIANLGDLFKVYLGSHLKYHMSEHESFRELQTLRESVKQTFIKKERHLIERKERLFKSQDISRWGFEGPQDDLIRRKDELLQDKEKAFRYMLTKESQELETFREELFFYSNQSLAEVRRVGTDNGLLLTDHFITMSQIQCAYVNQHHVMWADFLSHFSEIGMVQGAENYQVIKQRPDDYDSSKAAETAPASKQDSKEGDVEAAAATEEALGAATTSAGMGSFNPEQIDTNDSSASGGSHNRRISRLDDIGKFQASLDAVKVTNPRASFSEADPTGPAPIAVANTVREEPDEDLSAEEEEKKEAANTDNDNNNNNSNAAAAASQQPVTVTREEEAKDIEAMANAEDDANDETDNNPPSAAESGSRSQNQTVVSREESSGSAAASNQDLQEAN